MVKQYSSNSGLGALQQLFPKTGKEGNLNMLLYMFFCNKAQTFHNENLSKITIRKL